MSYMGSKNRFGHDAIDTVVKRHMNAGDVTRAQAMHEALLGITGAEDNIRRAMSEIRRNLDWIEGDLDGGYNLRGHLGQHPGDLAQAMAARDMHYRYLVALADDEDKGSLGI